MSLIKIRAIGIALIVAVICTGCFQSSKPISPDTSNETSAVSPYPDGVIEFFTEGSGGGDGALQCSRAFVSGTYSFRYGSNACVGKWDHITRFKVIGIPSASTFTFYDDENCSPRDNQKFIYTLKSMKNPTTTDLSIVMRTLRPITVGSLYPGTTLRMDRNLTNGDPRDLLGCVQITRSAVPETSVTP